MTYELTPKRGGYYWPRGERFEPTIDADLDYLLDGDANQVGSNWNLRRDVLITHVGDQALFVEAS